MIIGVLTNCTNLVPTVRGMEAAAMPVSVNQTAMASVCQGAAVVKKPDNTTRLLAGTATKLYEGQSGQWTVIGRAATYTLSTDSRWRFVQFGAVTLASNENDTIQFSSATGAFADISAAPKAAIVETVNNFVFAFDTNDGTFGDNPDGWWCCALGNYLSWTPSITTQAARGNLTSSPGKITAGKRFGSQIIAYKQQAMYVGTYQGAPNPWDFQEVQGLAGALSQEVVVNVGTPEQPMHIFMGYDNFYSFDGGRPLPIGNFLKDVVFNSELNRAYQHLVTALHDPVKQRIYFYYPSGANTQPTACVVYNYKTQMWGRDDRTIEAVIDYISTTNITYDDVGTYYATYDSFPDRGYDTLFLSSSQPVPAIINSSHIIQSLTGVPTSCTLTSGDVGDPSQFTLLKRVEPVFITAPMSGSMVNYYRNVMGVAMTTDSGATMDSNYRFDVLREAKWHRVNMEFMGRMEMATFNFIGEVSGFE